jgi:TnpA family transposase
MESWRQSYLGCETVPASLTEAEIAWFFGLDDRTGPVVEKRRRSLTRLGLTLHIGFLRLSGRSLSAVERLPATVLAFAAAQAGMPAPRIATLRSIYRRRMTLFEHQRIAAEALGFKPLVDHPTRRLTAFLRREATAQINRDALVREARLWLYDHGYVLPGARPLETMAAAAQVHALEELRRAIITSVSTAMATTWAAELSGAGPQVDQSLFDWLRAPITGFGRGDIGGVKERIEELRRLGAERIALPDVPIERIRLHARRIARRKAATLSRIKDPRRTVEIGCWLRLQLLELTDTVLNQASRRIGQLWSQARRTVELRALEELGRYRAGVTAIIIAVDDAGMTADAFHAAVEHAILPLRSLPTTTSKAQAIRYEMAQAPGRMRSLLKQVSTLNLDIAEDHPLRTCLTTLASAYDTKAPGLADGYRNPFPPAFAGLVATAQTPAARLAAFEVATAMLLKRSLRNGTASAPFSIEHRSVADQLMPDAAWAKVKGQTMRSLGWPGSLEAYLGRFEVALSERMEVLADTIAAGEVGVAGDRFQVPKLKAVPKDPVVDATRKRLFGEIGSVQLPDVIMAIDAQTRFSSVLLDREAANFEELEALYAGLLALGTEKTASDMARMLDGVSEDRIELAMRSIEESGHLRGACDTVASFMLRHPVTSHWGSGVAASADMMSLDATRHLWTSRIEPRRGTPAVGTYTHVIDQWAIIYDNPVVLNQRQAGVAIEGALRQKIAELQSVAVDTHGFTHFALATAKLLGFDLLPRLANLAGRKLYLPLSVKVPAELDAMVSRVKITPTARRGWDGLLHLSASLKLGYGSAVTILDRHGSAAQGTPVFECGTLVGKVVRSLFLLDYLTKPEFRREIHRVLVQGESVHLLQRALMAGRIEARHGRSIREVTAISNTLTLLTNIIMAWNTQAMQAVINNASPGVFPADHLTHIAPVAFKHINMLGKMHFDVENYGNLVQSRRRKTAAQ